MINNQDEKSNGNYPKFLPNLPCGEDLFEGKSQDKIADNIITVLRNVSSCKIIGIDGPWGSGKSNLVQLVAKKLKPQYHFFIYDAWGHQEDLQRRSILEELIQDLTNEQNSIIDGDWHEKLKILLSKRRETESKTIPKISYGIIISIIAIIATPILKVAADSLSPQSWWRLPVVAIPALGMLAIFIYYFNDERKKAGKKDSFKRALTRFCTIYQNRLEEEVRTEVISEEEPSVRKFINYMEDISKDLQQKKLVIVFDNMDRLPHTKVQELWSSIHIFFAENKYENIKVIVPFDRAHIKNAFKQEDFEQDKDNKMKQKKYGDDFIDKTFNIVYRVSPPILSDWKNYFKIQWDRALGNGSTHKTSFNSVLQIYDLLGKDVTPRRIIAFINEFISIKQLIGNTIPDEYVALFIAGKPKISLQPIDEIIKPSYLGSLSFMYEHDEDLPKYIAALFYQIDPDKAIQVIFTDKLKSALDNNDADEFKKISEISEFYDVLEKVIPEITNSQNAIVCLGSIQNDKIGTPQQVQGIWDYLYQKIQPRNDSQLAEFQLILLERMTIHKEEYLRKIMKELRSAEKFNVLDYVDSINSLNEKFTDLDVINKLMTKKIEAESFIPFIQKTKQNFTRYKITCEQADLNSYLSNLPISNHGSIDYIPYLMENYKLETFSRRIEELISASAPQQDYNTLSSLFRLYKELNIRNKPLKVKLDDSVVHALYNNNEVEDEFHYDLIAMRIAKLDKFQTPYAPIFEKELEKTDKVFVTKISERIEYFIGYGDILKGLLTFKSHTLLISVANNLTVKSYGSSSMNVEESIKIFDDICNMANIDPLILIKRLNAWKKYVDKITPQNVNSYVSIFFLKNALEEKCEITDHCIDCAIKYLNALGTDKWEESFKDFNSYEYQLSQVLNYIYSVDAFDAIKNILKEIAEQTAAIPNKELWEQMLSRVKGQGKDLVAAFNGVRDTFIREDNINPEVFNFFGDWLFKYSDMDEQKSSLRTIFKTEIIKNQDNLNLIIENKDKMLSIIGAAKDESKDFNDCIEEMLKTNNDTNFISFAKYIGITCTGSSNDNEDNEREKGIDEVKA
ncbi:P-loop NTPase fold protein [Arachidicoccus soli]|uniref:KAP NTPase domain-containing protein n=1 Tax=Arachidicoccus soli TaxID=2341117 RepID=A0A386HLL9_9BACT|nr:P-loop NTPase fold protein [Arachidicoccus soli]AYD46391.1 hypothetical protein D6B99_01410 [Arachidicoccus soli]